MPKGDNKDKWKSALGETPPPSRRSMSSKVEGIARICYEANRAYCTAMGDNSFPNPWDTAEEWQRDSCIEGVRKHIANPLLTPEQSHENWMQHKLDTGWKYGERKDPVTREHPSMRPYDKLPESERAKDHIFRAIVHAAKEL